MLPFLVERDAPVHSEGTGTFGRVRLVRHLDNGKFFALKISKKASIIRMKQVGRLVYAPKSALALDTTFAQVTAKLAAMKLLDMLEICPARAAMARLSYVGLFCFTFGWLQWASRCCP